jgi:hypothetical protein
MVALSLDPAGCPAAWMRLDRQPSYGKYSLTAWFDGQSDRIEPNIGHCINETVPYHYSAIPV